MNKLAILIVLVFLISAFEAYAQIDSDSTIKSGAICGNKVREPFEPCDLSSNASGNDFCPQIGRIAGIAMVCREELCSCLPRKYIVCEDKHTGGNEMCEAGDKDYCPKVGELLDAKLECNAKSCLCKATSDAFVSLAEETPENTTNLTKSLCGNRQVDENEQCDPPGRMCTQDSKVGICSESCKCEELKDDEANATAPETLQENITANTTAQSEENDDAAVTEPAEKTGEDIAQTDSGVSDTTYTVLLIILVVVFIVALGVGSFFIYKRSQIGDFDEETSSGEQQDSQSQESQNSDGNK